VSTNFIVFLTVICIFSICLNIFFVWYARRAIQQIEAYDIELEETIDVIRNFATHLKSVYEMEMFYGDETLRHLLSHARDIIAVFDDYDILPDEEDQGVSRGRP